MVGEAALRTGGMFRIVLLAFLDPGSHIGLLPIIYKAVAHTIGIRLALTVTRNERASQTTALGPRNRTKRWNDWFYESSEMRTDSADLTIVGYSSYIDHNISLMGWTPPIEKSTGDLNAVYEFDQITMTTAIPQPPSVPIIGHLTTVDHSSPAQSLHPLAQKYGDIFQLNVFGRKVVVLSSPALINEVSNDKLYHKKISKVLSELRIAVGDGLFTAHVPGEDNYYIARRIILPAFSTIKIQGMFDDMMDIASQLVLKWERFGPNARIDPAADMSALTLDTLCLCTMSYRLNSFYLGEMHPFVKSMTDFMDESVRRAFRLGFINDLMWNTTAQYEEAQRIMESYSDTLLEDRRANPTDKPDLLNAMINGVDKETGLKIPDVTIKRNLLTFLVAGHETTSGMMSFALFFLAKNPEAMRKLREEIDAMIGRRPMEVKDLNNLPYLLAVMRETLRLSPTAPLRAVTPYEDTVLAGKYPVEKDTTVVCGIYMAHRHPKVWGDDAEEFRPERMLGGKFEQYPENAWQPFGYGMRACTGRAFAWQEAQVALVCIVQKFNIVLDPPSYDLKLREMMTIKPLDMYIRAIPRDDAAPPLLAIPSSSLLQERNGGAQQKQIPKSETASDGSGHPVYVLYGSNQGCCEAFAQRIASEAPAHGFRASLGTMDSAVEHVPTDGPVVIITASYEGQPPDNAAHFLAWLENMKKDELKGVNYAIFGCGNSEWAKTFQRIPTVCDELLSEHSATRLLDRGVGNAAAGDFFDAFERWEEALWEMLEKKYGTASKVGHTGLAIEMLGTETERAATLRQSDTAFGLVVENRLLTSSGAPAKIHLEFDLPEGLSYRAGDYLAVLPANPARDVQRAMSLFNLSPRQEVKVTTTGPTPLPVGRPINAYSLLSGYVELAQPATTRDIRTLIDASKSEHTISKLQDMLSAYSEQILTKRLSLLDILEDYKDIQLSFAQFLQLLPSMRIRQYSISSSPLSDPRRVALTLSVLEAPAISGRKERFLGVASTYLAGLRPADKVLIAVRPSTAAFSLPQDPTVPVVMFCAGSGLAPMRGFLQERAMQKQSGREVAKSLLFFGCRTPSDDYLYSESDLKEWQDMGVVELRPAFSRATRESHGCKYVQDRVWRDRAEVLAAYNGGAKFYICGASRMATGVREKLIMMFKEEHGLDEGAARAKFDEDRVQGRPTFLSHVSETFNYDTFLDIMEQYQSSLKRSGRTLETDKASRMPERPRARMVEEWGSDFASGDARDRRSKKLPESKQLSKKAVKTSRDLLDDEESSEDELNFLSQSSKAGSSSPNRRLTSLKDAEYEDGVMVDGEFHHYHQAYMPKPNPLPSFKKNKKIESNSTAAEASGSTVQSHSPPARASSSTVVERSSLVDSATRPKHKALGMRPIPRTTNSRPCMPPVREADPQHTPMPAGRVPSTFPMDVFSKDSAEKHMSNLHTSSTQVPDSSKSKGKAKAQGQHFPMDMISSLEDPHEPCRDRPESRDKAKAQDFPMDVAASAERVDGQSRISMSKPKAKTQDFPMDIATSVEETTTRSDHGRNKDKAKTKAFPMDVASGREDIVDETRTKASLKALPLTEKSNAALRAEPQPFPMMISGSQRSTRSEPLARKSPSHSQDLSPFPSPPKSSPPHPTTSTEPKMGNTRRSSRRKGGVRKGRVASSSENADSPEEDTSHVQKKHEPKPFPMASQLVNIADSTYSKGKRLSLDENAVLADIMGSMEEEDSLLFLNPDIDPATLCPWCDERLPPSPSPHLKSLIAAARKHSSSDGRPTNPLGMYAAPAVFVSVCQRHRFESVQIPLAKKRGWPTHIDWTGLGGRVRRLRNKLQRIVDDVDEDCLQRQAEDDEEGDEKDAADDLELLETCPRKGSAFWKEVIKAFRKKGGRQASSVRGQMTSFSKTQPGYYGELGYVIINQTIYDLFPPAHESSSRKPRSC
ncbi:hypothetical protein NM688_g2547 [Phlebia brevispora]|uniref:Uncharacterized protein n=1 Tax=Phlebia brevispora TaxID=194682 RepID=A0ACC1T8K0_9APHY|nr:hypothetical protein NM688_g2547 [Phlebia brevispora]